MIEKKAVYKCAICGNIVESLWNGSPSISCCGQDMGKLEADTVDAAREKHVPVIERDGSQVTVKVGEAPHPMSSEHYILFIELLAGDQVLRQDLQEGDAEAVATFFTDEPDVSARAFCNLHGLWASK